MKTLILTAALFPLLTFVTAQSDPKSLGCYRSLGGLIRQEAEASSHSTCRDACLGVGNFTVEAMTKGTECYCGVSLPHALDKVEDSKCDISCPGSASDTCGSRAGDFFSVYSTGVNPSPPVDIGNSTVTTAGGKNSTTSLTTDGSTVTSTSIPTDTAKPKSTTSTGLAASKTGGGTASATSTPNSGDSVQIGGGMLVGTVMWVLAMVF